MNVETRILAFTLLGIGLLASSVWVACDARQRDRSWMVVTLLCLLTWPLGFLFWKIVRPPPAIR